APSRPAPLLEPAAWVPGLDDQRAARLVEARPHDLVQLDVEGVGAVLARRPGHGAAGQLGLTRPVGAAVPWIRGRAVDGDPRIPQQVTGLHRPGHRPQPDAAVVGELDLGTADPR